MNLILLEESDLTGSGTGAVVTKRRARHILEVHRAKAGDRLRVGLLGGRIGEATVTEAGNGRVAFGEIELTEEPPAPPGLDFILAMPRPKVLTRVLEAASSLGAKRIVLINAARVEKSYFDSPRLDDEAMHLALLRGLEQAVDTVLPDLTIQRRFRPYVEDVLPLDFPCAKRLAAHPLPREIGLSTDPPGDKTVPQSAIWGTLADILRRPDDVPRTTSHVVAIGPEGGFVPFEIDLLLRTGFELFHLGNRILRVETALSFIAGQFAALARTGGLSIGCTNSESP